MSCLLLEHGIDVGGVELKRSQVFRVRMSVDMCVFMALRSPGRGLVAAGLPIHTSCVL